MAGIYNASAKNLDLKPGKINNATLPDLKTFIQAGINPKTGLPYKVGSIDTGFKANNKKLLRIVDEQDAINRFTWFNLPNGLDSQLIERILYYRGQGMFFYMEENDEFYFLPYALDGTIDVYGRFVSTTPLPFNGTATNGKEKPWITGLKRKCEYSMVLDPAKIYDKIINSCVLLHDYTPQQSQTIISRQVLNDPLLDVMSDMIPFLRTALLNSTGIVGMRVNGEDEASNVEAASRSIDNAALTGSKYVPIVGNIEFQEMTGGTVGKSEEFLLAMQSLDNYRLGLYGLENGGLFQKKQQMLQAEQAMNGGQVSLVMQDGLENRQRFCDIVNSIWGLGIWCEISETASGFDMNSDGDIQDNEPETPSYESSGGDNESV